jgi:RND family efflux transporter MFP subunit
VLLAIVAGCRGEPPPASPAALPELAGEVVKPVNTPDERALDGTVEAVDQATISAQTAGRVAEILADVNDAVPAGGVLLRLRGAEQRAGLRQAEAAAHEAAAREAEAQARYARILDMYDRKVVAKAQLEQVTAERDAAVARLVAAKAAVDSAREGVAYTEVRAPYAVVITARHVQVGESVAPGAPLLSGLSLGRLRVTVDIPQSLAGAVRRLGRAAVYVDGRRVEATGVTVFPEADPATNTFRTRVQLPPDAQGLYPGMFVKVGFVTGVRPRLFVPRAAVLARSELTAVYVVGPDGRPALRQVRLGDPSGDRVEVLSGLVAGERVAIDALAALKALTAQGAGKDG